MAYAADARSSSDKGLKVVHMSKPRMPRSKKTSTTTDKEDKGEEESAECKVCTKTYTSPEDKLMVCERCDGWFCIKCLRMKPTVYDILRATASVHWFCDDCQEPAMTAVVTNKKIEETVQRYLEGITERLDGVEMEMDRKADKDMVNSLEDRVNLLEAKLDQKTKQMAEPQENVTRTSIEEIEQRARRRDNIILFGIDEAEETEDPEDRREHDLHAIEEVLAAIDIEANLEKPIRLGKKGEKPRPIRVKVPNPEQRKTILRKTIELAKVDKLAKKVFIKRDMTPMEQEDLRKLVEERDRKRKEAKEKGEEGILWTIWRGKVVKKQPKVEDRGQPQREEVNPQAGEEV